MAVNSLLSVALVCALLAGRAAADPVAISSTLDLTAFVDTPGTAPLIDGDSASQGATLNPLAVAVDTTLTDGIRTASASGSSTAAWLSAAAGTINLGPATFELLGFSQGNAWASFTSSFGWSYTFSVDAAGTFHLDYEATASSSRGTIGTNPYLVRRNGLDVGLVPNVGVGSIFVPLPAAGIYTIRIFGPHLNIGSAGPFTATQQGAFSWTITPVPEPGTFALCVVAVLVGFLGRRR